jgi:predicted hotdog family 3-hydroxylacyl-ACP dehydratase
MCLLERVLDWDPQGIRIETSSHRSIENPLRHDGRLKAVHLCEYGAQAMAAHGTLRADPGAGKPRPGMLVSLRSVSLHCSYIDALAGPLLIEATCLHASADSLQYSFRVSHAGTLLAEGRAVVALR